HIMPMPLLSHRRVAVAAIMFCRNLSSPDWWLARIIGLPESLDTVLLAFLLNALPCRNSL
ncbi:hypothetical protein Tco_0818159, partial [Tanacetum coccineum]